MVEAPGYPVVDAVEGTATLPSRDGFQVVDAVDDPDKLLRLHQVEGDGTVHLLALGDDALGYVPYDRGLYRAGVGPVDVDFVPQSSRSGPGSGTGRSPRPG